MNTMQKNASASESKNLSNGKPKYQLIRDKIADAVESGIYEVGSQLPSQGELSLKYEVSLQTVRQAIGMLDRDGLLSCEHGRGTFVRGLTSETIDSSTGDKDIIVSVLLGGDIEGSSYHRTELVALESILAQRGKRLVISQLTNQNIAEGKLPAALQDDSVAGVLLENYVQDVHIEFLRHHGFSMVVVGSCQISVPVANVVYDQEEAIYQMAMALGRLDKGPLYFITEPFQNHYTHELYSGYRKACREMDKSENLRTILCETKDPYAELRQIIRENDSSFTLLIHSNIAHAVRELFEKHGLELEDYPVAIYGAADYIPPHERRRFNQCGLDVGLGNEVAVAVLDLAIKGEKIEKVILEPELCVWESESLLQMKLKWNAPEEFCG